MKKRIEFSATREEVLLINRIVDRCTAELPLPGVQQVDLMMDIEAVHSNGCPLDLEKLLTFSKFDFAHDILGITRHIDRSTGKLGDFFDPRCSMPVKTS